VRVLLLSTYEVGRQPFGLASPAAWLCDAGFEVSVADLSRTRLDRDEVARAGVIALFLPMHTATRLSLPVLDRIREINPDAHVCAYGLYAPPNAELLRARGVRTIVGGEFEADLVSIARAVQIGHAPQLASPAGVDAPLPRLQLIAPDRRGLPSLDRYAALAWPDGTRRVTGYTEASRGCKHRCRHCPVVPIYNGRFRIVDPQVVLDDVRTQVASGATHVTFGDPDFWNGIGHARRIVTAFARQFPGVTYDVTIKIEHLLAHRAHLKELVDTGCAFVTSAVESVDDALLATLEKGHTRADFEKVAGEMRAVGLPLAPTFVSFTPWTSLQQYADLLTAVAQLDLLEHVAPVQWSIRLLIPAGSRLLELDEVRAQVDPFDPIALAHPWRHPDRRMDQLHRQVSSIVGDSGKTSRTGIAAAIVDAIVAMDPTVHVPHIAASTASPSIPHITEPWYCCAEPTEGHAALL